MSPSNADTQPVRAPQSGPGCLKRSFQLLFLTILGILLLACGYATGTGVEVLAPVRHGHPANPRMDKRDNDGIVCE